MTPEYRNWVMKKLGQRIPKLNPEFYTDHIVSKTKLLTQNTETNGN
jgi:hypothetical protein